MTKEEKAIEFVENFIKHGFRIDTMPTRSWYPEETAIDEYQWWSDYVTGAERRLQEAAKDVLAD